MLSLYRQSLLLLALGQNLLLPTNAFTTVTMTKQARCFTENQVRSRPGHLSMTNESSSDDKQVDVVQAAIDAMYGGKPLESPEKTRERIQTIIEKNQVVLFMKGNKAFPQCGFSDTATKILEKLDVEFQDVDVLSDDSIRNGIKDYSQWPTIPQLYIDQEFIGGSDIMLEMFQNGELADLLKKSD